MFILHRHASRNQTLGMVGRELLAEVSIPAQLRQVHSGLLIESFMARTAYARARLPRRPKLDQRNEKETGRAAAARLLSRTREPASGMPAAPEGRHDARPM